MSLTRKIIFAAFIALSILALAWAYFFLKNNKKPETLAVSVIPDSCAIYLNTPDFFELNKKINSQNLLVDKLRLYDDINAFCNIFQELDSLLKSNEELQEQLQNNRVHFALYGKKLNWLMAFNLKQLGEQKNTEDVLSKLFRAKKLENAVYAFRLSKTQTVFFTLRAGIVLAANSQELLSAALDNTKSKLEKNENFIAFKNTLEEKSSTLNIYVNHQNYAQTSAAEKLNLFSGFKRCLSAGNTDFQPSQITVNGFLSSDKNEIISSLKQQAPKEPYFTSILPLGTISFTAFGFDNFSNLHDRVSSNQNFWQAVNDTAMYNLEKEFYENIADNLVNFKTSQHYFVLAKVEDTDKALEQLPYMSDSLQYENSDIIFRLKKETALFFPLSESLSRYAALYGQYLFFSENKTNLLQLLHDVKNGKVMDKNQSFVTYKNQNFPEVFNFLIYASPNLLNDEMKSLFSFETKSETNPFETFKHFSFSATNYNNNFRFRWNLSHEAEIENKTVLWTLNLENPSQMKPVGFINHDTKENELLIQDEKNLLYLINAKGTVLWKKQLKEKILSPVYTIDAFNNKKFQLLFNTKNHIHLIDRNGNYVTNYPSKLPSEASSPLSVLDYDNTKEYRLFIACKNKTIYNYSIYGGRHEHFSPVKTEREVNLPVQYVKVGESDYLVTVDKEGKIYTFSRKGVGRIGLKNKTLENCQAFYLDATNNINSTYLVYVDDKNNSINKISFADKKETIELNEKIKNAQVNFDFVDNKRNANAILTTEEKLGVYSLNGNLLFEQALNFGGTTTFYGDQNRALYMTWNGTNKELYLFDQLNQTEKTMSATAPPLVSHLFNDGKKYLLVVNGAQLRCMLLN